MSKKDFQLIADVVSGTELTLEARTALAQGFVDRLTAVNPNFNVPVFLRACGVEA
jgi:hypothetical protein